MQGKVELCGVNTSKLPLLKNAEMRELIAAAQSGDMAARDKLINGNLRLVLSVIQKFSAAARAWTTCFRSAVSGLSKPLTALISARTCSFRPMAFR